MRTNFENQYNWQRQTFWSELLNLKVTKSIFARNREKSNSFKLNKGAKLSTYSNCQIVENLLVNIVEFVQSETLRCRICFWTRIIHPYVIITQDKFAEIRNSSYTIDISVCMCTWSLHAINVPLPSPPPIHSKTVGESVERQ